MGKRSAVVELFLGDMGSIQRETRPSMQREDQLTMETKLEQIAAKARREPNLRFTSLAHHVTRDRVQKNLSQIPQRSATGVDGQTVAAAKERFEEWIEPMLQSINRQGYRAPDQAGTGVVEGARVGRRGGPSELTRNPARRIDQCGFEQSLPAVRAGPLVPARCEGAVAGRSPTGTLYRRLCDLLPIALGRHP